VSMASMLDLSILWLWHQWWIWVTCDYGINAGSDCAVRMKKDCAGSEMVVLWCYWMSNDAGCKYVVLWCFWLSNDAGCKIRKPYALSNGAIE
jgi:hypothetical protein